MSLTKKSRDFLDKELFVRRNIVTFRSLSRELGIHVNDAKKELQLYYDAVHGTNAPAVPTYLVSGEVTALDVNIRPEAQRSDSAMDLDLEFEEDRDEVDLVYQTKVLLVDARQLEEAKSQFSRVNSVHIYSLSPSRLGDAGLVCIPSYTVRRADTEGGPASFSVTGKITGSHVKRNAGAIYQHTATSSKTTLDVQSKALAPIGAEQQITKSKASSSETKEQSSATTTLPKRESKDKSKPLGKLDWSKAKTKDKESIAGKAKEDKKPKPEPESEPDSTIVTKSLTSKKSVPGLPVSKSESGSAESADVQKRGVKRKPDIDTEEESESDPLPVKAGSRVVVRPSVKKEVTDSDDDEDGGVRMLGLRRPKRKSTMSLRAMMDIDDELVDRVSGNSKVRPQPEESEESEEELGKEATAPPATSEDEESDHIPIVQKKRKPRKIVPVGRNGLKKRRVVKSRMATDAKGYMQTEDYSSYESVEEEEAETKPKVKGKGTKKALEPKVEAESKAAIAEESTGKPKAKSGAKSRGGAPKRGGLMNFFGPQERKK